MGWEGIDGGEWSKTRSDDDAPQYVMARTLTYRAEYGTNSPGLSNIQNGSIVSLWNQNIKCVYKLLVKVSYIRPINFYILIMAWVKLNIVNYIVN